MCLSIILMKLRMTRSSFVFILFTSLVLFACDNSSQQTTLSPNTQKKKAKLHLVESSLVDRSERGIVKRRTGTLRASYEVKIHNQEEGRIVSLPLYEGDRVKKGQVIAKLDDSLLRAQLKRIQANRRKAESDLTRIKSLRKEAFLSEEELIKVETELAVAKADEAVLQTRLDYANIKAPFSGVVTQRLTEIGNIAERFTHLLTVSDPSSLITEVSISEMLLNHIKPGDETQVQIDALGKQQYKGRVKRVHPTINPVTRRGTIEIELKPVPTGARPGQLCRIEIQTQAASRLLIPLVALRRNPEGEFVFIIDESNKAKMVAVTSGVHIDEQVEILTGLEAGQQIITKGFLNLKSGKKVKSVSQNKETRAVPHD